MKIGVFDSGIGGKSVALAIEEALPQHTVIFVNDTENVPYGLKTPEELYKLVLPILQNLASKTDIVVVACNTVSTTLIGRLREAIKTPLVAVEPMVKPAAMATHTKTIAVCATPTTLASPRYAELKSLYAKGIKILEPDCSDWSLMIESNNIDKQKVQDRIDSVCDEGADVIVLGCTHYHWIEEIIKQEAKGRAQVIQPEQPVVEQVKRLIAGLEPRP